MTLGRFNLRAKYRQPKSWVVPWLSVDIEKEAYIMEHLLSHLIEAKNWDGIKMLLSDIDYLEMRHQPAEQFSFQKDSPRCQKEPIHV